jgi:hypothetical protein
VSQESVCKLRLYIDRVDHLAAVPIFFPAVATPTDSERTNCDGRKVWKLPFCEQFPLRWYRGDADERCFACADFNWSVRLGAEFVRFARSSLPTFGIDLKSWQADGTQLEMYFREKTRLVLAYLMTTLDEAFSISTEEPTPPRLPTALRPDAVATAGARGP